MPTDIPGYTMSQPQLIGNQLYANIYTRVNNVTSSVNWQSIHVYYYYYKLSIHVVVAHVDDFLIDNYHF